MSQELPSHNKVPEISSPETTRVPDKELIDRGLDMIDHIIAHKSLISTQEEGWTPSAIRQTEARIHNITKHENIMKKLLANQGIEVALEKVGKKLFKIPLDEKDVFLEKLPPGYMYRGGAARAMLHRKLGIDTFATPRDIDIAYAGSKEADKETHYALASKFAPDDLAQGYGVEQLNEDYFEQQDFTINEILATHTAIYLTSQCLLDNARGILRLSDFEKHESYRGNPYFVNDKLLAKALRFIAERNLTFWNDDAFDFQGIRNFHIALHFDRAWGTGYETARHYMEELHKRNQIPKDIQTPEELRDFLHSEVNGDEEDEENLNFIFRHAKKLNMGKEIEFLEEHATLLTQLEDAYQDYPLRGSMLKT